MNAMKHVLSEISNGNTVNTLAREMETKIYSMTSKGVRYIT